MKIRSEDFKKITKLFKSPAGKQVYKWSQCIHGNIILICVITVILVLLSLSTTLVTKELIDAAVSSDYNNIWKYGAVLLGVVLCEIALYYILGLIRLRTGTRFQRVLQGTIIREILSKEYQKLRGYHSGELVNRVFSDGGTVKSGVLSIIPGIVSTMISFIGAATILIVLDWRFVLLLFIAGIIGLAIVLLFRKPMKERHKRMRKAEDRLHSSIQETLENIRLIKASVSEGRVFRQIDHRQEILQKEQIRQGKFSVMMNNSMNVMFDFSWLFCMLWGCAAIFRGELTYGSLAAMIQLIGRVQGPITDAVAIATELYGVIASAERLMELTELPSEPIEDPVTAFDEINVEHVSFRYDDESEYVLKDVSCRIHKGDFVALTGASGGGKTSLFQLLLNIYPPNTGNVEYIIGTEKVQASRATRSLFAYVPQGNTLFSGTLRENLTMFTDEASDEEILQAMRAACIEELAAEPGLDTEIGERGVGISEGQAQRVAVARALLTKAPILLLDESTSALDEETEAQMLKNISEMRDKTLLIVTHRRAALSICDYQLHISEGAINIVAP